MKHDALTKDCCVGTDVILHMQLEKDMWTELWGTENMWTDPF